MKDTLLPALAIALALSCPTAAQIKGPSTGSSPYLLPTQPYVSTYSIITTDNTGAVPDDNIGGYGLAGIPDGLGAYDNGDGTFTLLVNHELSSGTGVVRAHGAAGAFVSAWVISKSNFAVNSGTDLMRRVFTWNSTTQRSNTTAATVAFSRFCSGDLAAPSAFYNSGSGLGSTARIYLHGEEGSSNGYQLGTVATGADKGNSYVLGKFNLSTNGSGNSGLGSWENALANPYAQNKTIVIGNNDGGSGIMNNAIAIYVGTKSNAGSEVDKAGLTNGTTKFVRITGNPVEVVNPTTRATNIASGTPFTLSSTASTTFSRPEDGAWNTLDAKQYYFVTTDVFNAVADGLGSQIGRSRLWRLNFTDLTNPDTGGTIDLLLDGTEGQNMFDNITVSPDGSVFLEEDTGSSPHNDKVWKYNPVTDTLVQVLKHDPARFGDLGTAATFPFTADEEASGIIDISSIMGVNGGSDQWLISTDQAHYTSGISAAQVEGGQLFAIHVTPEPTTALSLVVGAGLLLARRRRMPSVGAVAAGRAP